MKKQLYWGFGILILFFSVVGVFLLIPKDTDTEPEKVYKAPSEEVSEKAQEANTPSDDITLPPRAVQPSADTGEPSEQKLEKRKYATEPLGYEKEGVEGMYITHIPRDPSRFADKPPPPLPPSSVPDDIPEHLKLPPEWIDGVYRDIEPPPPDDTLTDEIRRSIGEIIQEVVRNYNPKRSYADIWDQFIEYEKMYRAYAEYELGYTPQNASMTCNRVDWLYEQVWAFPEFMELGNTADTPPPPGEESRFLTAYDIAMGIDHTGWNHITLKDGRDFYIKGETRYEFVYQGVTEAGDEWKNVTGFSRTRVTESTPVITIDVYNTSDEELKRLMGWDYRVNPITMKPMQDNLYDYILHRRIE